MRKVPLEGWRDFPEPSLPNLSLTASPRLLQPGLSQHVQQFVLATEGSSWQMLIPALGSSSSEERRGPHSALAPPEPASIPEQQLRVIPTQRGGHC